MTFIVPVICAWCGEQIDFSSGHKTQQPTHGICKDCLSKQLEQLGGNDGN